MAKFAVGEKVRHALKGKIDMLVDDAWQREDGMWAYRCSWVGKGGDVQSAEFAEIALTHPPAPRRYGSVKIKSKG